MPREATFFATPAAFRAWLEKHHEKRSDLLVGFFKRASSKPSITWPESVDEALCFGWIDGVRRSVDATSYTIRFTPRRSTSTWSTINVNRVKALVSAGRMQPAGLRAFQQRRESKSGIYSYERREEAKLSPEDERRLRANEAAFTFFRAQAPWYQRTAIHWVVSAKKDETRQKRLGTLIDDSASGRTIRPLTRPLRRA